MKQLLLLVILALFCLPTLANTESPDVSLRYLCSSDSLDYFQFSTTEQGEWTFVPQDNGETVYLENFSGETILSFPKPSNAILFYFGLYIVDVVDTGNKDCVGTPSIYVEPLNECLGVSPESVGMPHEGVFTVDNHDYSYNGNLSFAVPQSAVWQWDLFHEGNYVLSFAQSEDSPCGIVGG